MSIRVEVKQGRGGRWRWFLRRGGKFVGMGSIRGFSSHDKALRDATRALSEPATADGEYGELYAGERDFSD